MTTTAPFPTRTKHEIIRATTTPEQGISSGSSSSRPNKNTAPGGAKKKKTAKKRRPPRSLSGYNIFFGHERARILAVSLLSGGQQCARDLAPPSDLRVEDVRRFVARNPYDAPGAKSKKRRKHRKTHGMVSFVELNRIVSRNWKALDEKGKAPFYEVAKELKAKFVIELEREQTRQQQLEASSDDVTTEETTTASWSSDGATMKSHRHADFGGPTTDSAPPVLPRRVSIGAADQPPRDDDSPSSLAARSMALEPIPLGGFVGGGGGGPFALLSTDPSVLCELSEVLSAVFCRRCSARRRAASPRRLWCC